METLCITRGSSPIVSVIIKQPNSELPMSLVGIPVAVIESNLPITIAVTKPGAAGAVSLTFPDTTLMELRKSYIMKLLVGTPGAAGTFATPFIEVMAI